MEAAHHSLLTGRQALLSIHHLLSDYHRQNWMRLYDQCSITFDAIGSFLHSLEESLGLLAPDRVQALFDLTTRLRSQLEQIVLLHIDEPDGEFVEQLFSIRTTVSTVVDELEVIHAQGSVNGCGIGAEPMVRSVEEVAA